MLQSHQATLHFPLVAVLVEVVDRLHQPHRHRPRVVLERIQLNRDQPVEHLPQRVSRLSRVADRKQSRNHLLVLQQCDFVVVQLVVIHARDQFTQGCYQVGVVVRIDFPDVVRLWLSDLWLVDISTI